MRRVSLINIRAILATGLSMALCLVEASDAVPGFVPVDGAIPAADYCIPEPPVPRPEGCVGMAFDTSGNYWTLARADGGRQLTVLPCGERAWRPDTLSRIAPGRWRHVLMDEHGAVWVADDWRLWRLDPHHPERGWARLEEDSAFPDGRIRDLAIAPSGSILAALDGGRLVETDRVRTRHRASNRLTVTPARADIRGLVVDRDGATWCVDGQRQVYRRAPGPEAWQRHWELVARMPSGTHDLSVHVLDGRFYMAGGITADRGYPSTGGLCDQLWSFDPGTARWRVAGTMLFPQAYCATAPLGGKVWLAGGNARRRGSEERDGRLVQVYDPSTGDFAEGPSLPVAIPACFGVSIGDRMYVPGHTGEKGTRMRLYSIGAGEPAWRREPDGPVGGGAYGTALDGKLYVVVSHKCLAEFDPAAGQWREIETPHSPRSCLIAPHAGEIWLMGGRTKEGGEVTWMWSPATGQWRRGPRLPRELVWGAAFSHAGRLHITGGAAGRCYNNRTFRLR